MFDLLAIDDAKSSEHEELRDMPSYLSNSDSKPLNHPMSPIPKNLELSPGPVTQRGSGKKPKLQLYRFPNEMSKAKSKKSHTNLRKSVGLEITKKLSSARVTKTQAFMPK